MKLALKIDVDTYDGMRDGVPNFLKLLRELKITASFFIPFGPDESGKAIFRVFRKKGFLKKMSRTNPMKLYGIKTMLRGTILPAPMIGSSFPEIVKSVIAEGHELGIHGYNHVLWQDHLLEMTEAEVKSEFDSGVNRYAEVIGKKPSAFAAPAWLCSPTSLKMVDAFRFDYASDSRGTVPFFPSMNGQSFSTLQIPSTLPTTDEMLGLNGMDEKAVHDHFTKLMQSSPDIVHVHTIHTEVEGTALFKSFSDWLRSLKSQGVTLVTLDSIAKAAMKEPKKIPRCEVTLKEIPGRAGPVACQKTL